MKHCIPAVALLTFLAACGETPTDPTLAPDAGASFNHVSTHQVFTSGAQVLTWDPILPASADPNWPTTVCTSQPAVGLNAAWQNQHNAYVLGGHPWSNDYFLAPWINAWNNLSSVGPGGHNWTKYETAVSGNGSFVIRLLADNCSWIYLDGTLVGVQNTNLSQNSYGLNLNGSHTLSFIIFDGGGAAGGKFLLETTSNPPPPLDSDGDGHPNTGDTFPFDPTEWADSDGDGVGDNADAFPNDASETADSDGDGVGNNADTFPNSILGGTVTIGSCNSGVENRVLPDGSTFSDRIEAARAASANHGGFVNAVTQIATGWRNAGLISGKDHGQITACAARSK